MTTNADTDIARTMNTIFSRSWLDFLFCWTLFFFNSNNCCCFECDQFLLAVSTVSYMVRRFAGLLVFSSVFVLLSAITRRLIVIAETMNHCVIPLCFIFCSSLLRKCSGCFAFGAARFFVDAREEILFLNKFEFVLDLRFEIYCCWRRLATDPKWQKSPTCELMTPVLMDMFITHER